MPNVPYARTIRIVCHSILLGEESVNVHHALVDPSEVLTVAEMQAIADTYAIFYNANSGAAAPNRGIENFRHNNLQLDKVSVYDLRTVPNPPPVERTYAVFGSGALTKVPFEECGTLTLQTAVGTRRGRGRIYIGPLGDGAYTLSTTTTPPRLSDAFNTAVRNAYVDLDTRLQSVASLPILPAVLSVADGVSREVTSIKMDFRPDTQRRRELSLSFPAPAVTTIG